MIARILWATRDWIGFETECGHAHARPLRGKIMVDDPFECYCSKPSPDEPIDDNIDPDLAVAEGV